MFPVDLITLERPVGSQNRTGHADLHVLTAELVEALMAKVGIDSSTNTASIDYLLKNPLSISPGHKHAIADINGLESALYSAGNTIYLSSTGNDSYEITVPGVTSLNNKSFRFQVDVGNTGPATLNVNGLGAKTIVKNHDSPLVTGDIEPGQVVTVSFDGTNFQMDSQQALLPSIDFSTLAIDPTLAPDNYFLVFNPITGNNEKMLGSEILRYLNITAQENITIGNIVGVGNTGLIKSTGNANSTHNHAYTTKYKMISENVGVAFYNTSLGTLNARMFTINGNVVTWGTNTTILSLTVSLTSTIIDVIEVSAGQLLFAYYINYTTGPVRYGYIIPATYSGTNLTVGSAVNYHGYVQGDTNEKIFGGFCKAANGKAALSWTGASSTYFINFFTISGNAVTGTGVARSLGTEMLSYLQYVSEDKIFAWRNASGDSRIITVSALTSTDGSNVVHGLGTTAKLVDLGTKAFAIGTSSRIVDLTGANPVMNTTLAIAVGTYVGKIIDNVVYTLTTNALRKILINADNTLTDLGTQTLAANYVNPSYIAKNKNIMEIDTNTAIVVDFSSPIGISQETKTAGQSTIVTPIGTKVSITGGTFTAGLNVYNNNGVFTHVQTGTKIGTAISSTDLIINAL